MITAACAADPLPPSQPVSRPATIKTDGPLEKTTLTNEQRSALDAELGDGFAKAMEGNLRHPYGSVAGPQRGVTAESFDVDYASIPLLTEVPTDKARDPTGFRLFRSRTPSPECDPGFGHETWSLFGLDALPAVVRIGNRMIPPTVEATGKLARAPDISIITASTADWTTLDRRNLPATVTRFEASYDHTSAVAKVKRRLTAHPLALAHDQVFVTRRCTANCDHDLVSTDRGEELEIIGPRALWIGSSADVERFPLPDGQPFTDLSAHVAPGRSAMVLFTMKDDTIDVPEGAPPSPLVTTISVEIVWQSGQLPQATVFTTRLRREDTTYTATPFGAGFSEGCQALQ